MEKDGQILLAKSYDWIVEDGLVVVNKRQMAKQAMTNGRSMRWVSKFGSNEMNRKLVDSYYSQVPFLRDLPDYVREFTARYPDKIYYVVE